MTHILVVGSGGREHALAWKLSQSPRVEQISIAPGNGGTIAVPRAQNVDIDATDIVSLLDFAETEGIDLTVVGPEEPLAGGLVDQFDAVGLPIFGPHRRAALIETSKSYAKSLMLEYGVPTAPYEVFQTLDSAREYLMTHSVRNLVIKADGLASGKGVFLPAGDTDAEGILRALLERDSLGNAGRRVIIERRLEGDELTIMAFTDGKTLAMMPAVRGYKRLYDNAQGPNTGGMGAYAPAPALTTEQSDRVRACILEPILAGLRADDTPFRGVLYLGVILTSEGPMALELNARFSDPGAQVVLPLLETDLLDVLEACVNGTLAQQPVRWRSDAAATVVAASGGYPDRHDPGLPIRQSSPLPENAIAFHAGTQCAADGQLMTTGGRVLALTGTGPDLPSAIQRAYDAVHCFDFPNMHYRQDIGSSVR